MHYWDGCLRWQRRIVWLDGHVGYSELFANYGRLGWDQPVHSDGERDRQLQYGGYMDRERRNDLFDWLVDCALRHYDYFGHGDGDFDAEYQRGGNG